MAAATPQNYYVGPQQHQQQPQSPQGQLKYAPNASSPSVQPPMNQPYGEPPPYTFEEKFAIQRPRYNDLLGCNFVGTFCSRSRSD